MSRALVAAVSRWDRDDRPQQRGRAARVWSTVVVTALTCFGLAAPVPASADTAPPTGTPATVSADRLPTWQIDGVVWASVLVGNTVYVTGEFAHARPPGVKVGEVGEIEAQNIFAFDLLTGNRVATFNHSLGGPGKAIVASADGSRVFVGGNFTSVDNQPRGHLAAFSTVDHSLDAGFQPSVDVRVAALAVRGSTLYVGGNFTSVTSGTTKVNRKSLAALDTTTKAILPWAPQVDNGAVTTMVVAPGGGRVVVGGSFTTIGGSYAYGMGSLDATTGTKQPWAANQTIRDAGAYGAITSLRTDGQRIYGAGYDYAVGDTANFEGTFAADPSTGQLTVVNNCHGDTYDVLPLGGVLYSVGHAHDCSWIGSFPDTKPRVRWQRVLAQTTTATTTNKGPDDYGYNYAGLPASAILHWFPDLTAGNYTQKYQAAWTVTGNTDYLVLAGEFLTVNGTAQQGLVRMAVKGVAPNKRGPTYATKPATPVPATTATSLAPGTVQVTFGSAWDYDNNSLTYELLRDGGSTAVASLTGPSNFWTLPSRTLTDTGLVPGSSHTYRVRIKDPFGNVLLSPVSNAVTS